MPLWNISLKEVVLHQSFGKLIQMGRFVFVTLFIWVNVPIELAQYLQEIVRLRCLLNEETQFMSWQKSSVKELKMCLKMLICVFYHTCEIKTADQLVLCRHFIRKVWMKKCQSFREPESFSDWLQMYVWQCDIFSEKRNIFRK